MSLITLKMLICEGVVQHIWVESGRRQRGDVSIYGPSVYKDILWIPHLNHECGQFMEDKKLTGETGSPIFVFCQLGLH